MSGRRVRDIRGVFYADPEVGGMPGRRVYGEGKKPGSLQEHYMYRHWESKVAIVKE